MKDTVEADIEVILRSRFPLLSVLRPAHGLLKASPDPEAPDGVASPLAKFDALRADLLKRSPAELREMAAQCLQRERERDAADKAAAAKRRAQEAETAERARFYNQPEAMADFGFWLKLDTWTPSDAAALLLGIDPRAVNPDTLRRELSQPVGLLGMGKPPKQSAFHKEFERLELIMSRTEQAVHGRIKPVDAVRHAQGFELVLPAPLQSLVAQAPAPTKSNGSGGRKNDDRWTEDERRQLAAYREKHGTKAAAKRYGISDARVRALLPKKPKAPSPFPAVTRTGRK